MSGAIRLALAVVLIANTLVIGGCIFFCLYVWVENIYIYIFILIESFGIVVTIFSTHSTPQRSYVRVA